MDLVTLLTPADCRDVLGGDPVVEVRVPAVADLGEGRALLAVDARLSPVDQDWENIGGAMAADLPNPNSLLLATVDLARGKVTELRVLRRGQAEPRRGFSDPCLFVDGAVVGILHARSTGTGFFGSVGWRGDDYDPQALHIDCSISVDGGATFTHQPITGQLMPPGVAWLGAFVTSGHGVICPRTGAWLAPLVVRTPAGQSLAIIRSEDQGRTWASGELLGTDMDETAFVFDGNILSVSSRGAGAYRSGALGRWEAISLNGGGTWAGPVRWVADPPVAACNACLVATPRGTAFLYPGAGREGGYLAWGGLTRRITTGHYGYCDALWTGEDLAVFYEHEGTIRLLRVG